MPKLEKGISLIADRLRRPAVGPAGTVVGMIATFQAITLFGTGDPKLMAGGISEALVTTMQGLVVAVPMLFLYTIVQTQSRPSDPGTGRAERRFRCPLSGNVCTPPKPQPKESPMWFWFD